MSQKEKFEKLFFWIEENKGKHFNSYQKDLVKEKN